MKLPPSCPSGDFLAATKFGQAHADLTNTFAGRIMSGEGSLTFAQRNSDECYCLRSG